MVLSGGKYIILRYFEVGTPTYTHGEGPRPYSRPLPRRPHPHPLSMALPTMQPRMALQFPLPFHTLLSAILHVGMNDLRDAFFLGLLGTARDRIAATGSGSGSGTSSSTSVVSKPSPSSVIFTGAA